MNIVVAAALIAALVPAPVTTVDACPTAPAGHARCLAQVRAGHDGYGPADLRTAYSLPSTGGSGQTVAVVDAGDDQNAEADLAVYRSTYGLPACTTANGCFRKVNQRGDAGPPPDDQGWAVEIALDIQMVSAACPACHILLVEADDPAFANLAAAVDTAVRLGATEVSNSYGATEQNGIDQFQAAYRHPGVAVLASSGDDGYGIPSAPAVFPSVIAVGGTSLTRTAKGWTESAWAGAGSGCSAYVPKPAWQHDANCPGRMTADVAAVADPRTGPAVYDTHDDGGWIVVGGTSASSPYLAGVIALAGHPERFSDASYLYSHANQLHDVVGGTNARATSCGGDYQCTAVRGYDGPTGNGTPHGLAAF